MYIPFVTVCSILYVIFSVNYPFVGTDVEYYFPRFLDVFLHFKTEGIFSIQWWTPSFGGGIPAFPNPGHMQFVLIPYLMHFLSPWQSTLITYLIFNFIAYKLIFDYFNRHLSFNRGISVCAAVIFITNGFWLNHALVGHINFSTFLLTPLSFHIFWSRWSFRMRILCISLFLIYIFHAASIIVVFIFYTTLPLLYLVYRIFRIRSFRIKIVFKTLFISHVIFGAISLSKLCAMYLHTSEFPRLAHYETWQPYFQTFFFTVPSQLFAWTILKPIEFLLPHTAESFLFWIIGSKYGFWENDISFSPVVPIILLIFFFRKRKYIKDYINSRNVKFYIFLLLIYLYFFIEFIIGKGFSYKVTSEFPLIKSLHVNMRFTASFILPCLLIFSIAMRNICMDYSRNLKILLSIVIVFISILSLHSFYKLSITKKQLSEYDLSLDNKVWKESHYNNYYRPITDIIDVDSASQSQMFYNNSSSHTANCPLYGYHGDFFLPKTKIGKIKTIKDGYYNFHDPRSFYSPSKLKLEPSMLFSYDKVNELDEFLNRKQPMLELPTIQLISNVVSITALTILFLYILVLLIRKIIKLVFQ